MIIKLIFRLPLAVPINAVLLSTAAAATFLVVSTVLATVSNENKEN